MKKTIRPLRELAAMYSLLTAYTDAAGKRQVATDAGLIGILRALGVDIDKPSDARRLLPARKRELYGRPIEPVTIAWDGRLSVGLNIRSMDADKATYELTLENGERTTGKAKLREVKKRESNIDATDFRARPSHRLRLGDRVPEGYHDLRVKVGRKEFATYVLSAPRESYSPEDEARSWGVFLPIYALASKKSWGGGDFGDFQELARFVESRGGSVVATLPILATFLENEGPFEPSPYSPASRLFWNEFYIDISRVPELAHSPKARDLLESDEFQQEIRELRKAALVDYRRQMTLKRRVLEELARTFFESGSPQRREQFEQYINRHPAAADYARFRATTERQKKGWPVWPKRIRSGDLREGDFAPDAERYHLYAQWITNEQLTMLAENARSAGRGLYLDFPLGVHPDGYDVWRERKSFAREISVGAPPDPFFTKGQNWGFPPLHPERIREDRYRYFIHCVRHHMAHAGILRLDHVMALHRLYWIPQGAEAKDGVYVRYQADELYAIMSIESHRHRTMMVGEDLGTVPGYVRTAMNRHRLRRMYVLQYEARPDTRNPVSDVIPGSVASLNTHDMPTFSAFWNARDVDSRVEMGLLEEDLADQSRQERGRLRESLTAFLRRKGSLDGAGADDPVAVHDACMAFLSRSNADVVLVNVEDLWLEQQPQNTPGTSDEKPNWRRKAKKSLEEIRSSPSITLRLKSIDLNRKR